MNRGLLALSRKLSCLDGALLALVCSGSANAATMATCDENEQGHGHETHGLGHNIHESQQGRRVHGPHGRSNGCNA